MSDLDDAAREVAEARRNVHEFLWPLAATTADQARAAIARLEAAVRRHDAETLRDHAEQEGKRRWTASGTVYVHGVRAAADRLRPGWESEVEARFAYGPTIRIARHSVTADASAGEVMVEGFIASSDGQPPSGDAVRLAYLGIPGRGALYDITASVVLYSRLEVPHIRIRTTIQPEDRPA